MRNSRFNDLSEPELTGAQFRQRPGSEADRLAHWSVWRGDPHPNRPDNRKAFQRHLPDCDVCRSIEAERTSM